MAAARFALLLCLLICNAGASAAPVALVLDDPGLPRNDAPLNENLSATLRRAGYEAAAVSVDGLLAPGVLTTARCALVVLPQAKRLPGVLLHAVERYLQAGGNLLALGAPLAQTQLVRGAAGRWVAPAAVAEDAALLPPEHTVFALGPAADLSGWRKSTNEPAASATHDQTTVTAAGRTAGALHVVISNLTGWETLVSPEVRQPFRSGDSTTVFSARGAPGTHALAVEWTEADGSRWIATVPLTPRWQRFALPPAAFKSWLNPADRAAQGLHPAGARRLSVGLAFTHTGQVGGRHEFWISDIGTAPASDTRGYIGDGDRGQPFETLAPQYKFYNITTRARLGSSASSVLPRSENWPQPAEQLMSSHPRPGGAGFGKGRDWRWVPLLTAIDAASGQWRGTPATLMLHTGGSAYHGGSWAVFTPDDTGFYRQPQVLAAIGQVAGRLLDGRFLLEGGADCFTYFPGQPVRVGARIIDNGRRDHEDPAFVRLTISGGGHNVWQRVASVAGGPGASCEWSWPPPSRWPAGGYEVTTELLQGNHTLDRQSHAIALYEPSPKPQFVTIGQDGHFYRDGRRWRANGVNYMPSSGLAQEDGAIFEKWLSAAAYDPEVIERDLGHIEDLGFNAVSAFIYEDSVAAQNLLDFLRRCRQHHLLVNLSLRRGFATYLDGGTAAAMSQAWHNYERIVKFYRTAENDTVFAYELDWEPSFGDQQRRRRIDPEWEQWVSRHYGGLAAAEGAWGVPVPRDGAGRLTNPAGSQLASPGGPEGRLVRDYRHFLDDWLVATYGELTRRLHGIAPHQPVSFRMASAGNPADNQGGDLPYQLEGLARAVDFLSPESYGRIGSPAQDLTNLFEIAYARAVAPHQPVIWAETGVSAWDEPGQRDDPQALAFEGRYYATFYRLAQQAGADGVFWWWYPGGYRVGEKSDYGLINPDGTDRPATVAIRQQGREYLQAGTPPAPDVQWEFDRDAHPDGIYGIYRDLHEPFAAAIAAGHRPGLRARAQPLGQ